MLFIRTTLTEASKTENLRMGTETGNGNWKLENGNRFWDVEYLIDRVVNEVFKYIEGYYLGTNWQV